MERNPKVTPNDSEIEDCNIGIEKEPRIIIVSKSLTPESKKIYVSLMKEFIDVFARMYENLKGNDTNITHHTIPVKEDEKHLKRSQ